MIIIMQKITPHILLGKDVRAKRNISDITPKTMKIE